MALLLASALAGWLWDIAGPGVTFAGSAIFAAIALAGLMAAGRDRALR
jgi:hypothetical protein